MIIKKTNKYNDLKNNTTKRLVSLALVLSIPLTQTACKSTKEEYVSDNNNSIVSEDNTNLNSYCEDENFFANKKAYYEYSDNQELNEVIEKLKSINFISENEHFNNFDIYSSPTKEINELLSREEYYVIKSQKFDINYDWYINEEVDCDLLYNKLIDNTKSKNIKIDNNIKVCAKKIAEQFKINVNEMKQKYPSFDFNTSFYNMDNLIVTNCYDDKYISFYESSVNEISTNFNNIANDLELNLYILHETRHLTLNKVVGPNYIYMNGISIDLLDTDYSSLNFDFFNEYFVQKSSCDTLNCPELRGYDEESEKIKLLCYSTKKSEQYFQDYNYTSNQNGLINSFETELQDFNYVYSTLYALELSCGYGIIPEGCNAYEFRKDCFDYARFNLIKNNYINIIKQYYIGSISKDVMIEEINKAKSFYDSVIYNYDSYSSNSAYYEYVEQLDNIVKSCYKNL